MPMTPVEHAQQGLYPGFTGVQVHGHTNAPLGIGRQQHVVEADPVQPRS